MSTTITRNERRAISTSLEILSLRRAQRADAAQGFVTRRALPLGEDRAARAEGVNEDDSEMEYIENAPYMV